MLSILLWKLFSNQPLLDHSRALLALTRCHSHLMLLLSCFTLQILPPSISYALKCLLLILFCLISPLWGCSDWCLEVSLSHTDFLGQPTTNHTALGAILYSCLSTFLRTVLSLLLLLLINPDTLGHSREALLSYPAFRASCRFHLGSYLFFIFDVDSLLSHQVFCTAGL